MVPDLPTALARDRMAPPFLIMGCPRSGTTLAAQLLDSHARMRCFGKRSDLLRLGWYRWKMRARVRARCILTLGPLRRLTVRAP
jgi:hypothetical protein